MAGRPTKLTPALKAKFVSYLSNGNTIKASCLAVGISQQAFENWMNRGEKEQKGVYFRFYMAVKKAQANFEIYCLNIINRASIRSWRAAAWFLERRFPERWGRRRVRSY